jgi:hypothetical protein
VDAKEKSTLGGTQELPVVLLVLMHDNHDEG